MKFPLPLNESQRLEELRSYGVLDTAPEKAFDRITKLAARIFNTPIASVTLIDEDRQWFKSCLGLETREVGRNVAFCAYAILEDEVMVVPDAREDARFAENPLVTGPPYIRFYAGAPLKTKNGLNLGTLCINDTEPRELRADEGEMLAGLASLAVSEMELRYEIGKRQRAEESLRLLQSAIEQSEESVIITTAKLDLPGPEIVFVNPAFTKCSGYSAAEVIGKTPRIFQGPKTDRAILDGVRAHLANGEEFRFEAVNYRKDGSDFVLACHIIPIRGKDGTITHFIDFQRDATERDLAAAALLQAKEEAERANRAKSEFLSRMSHELRTPLHVILGFAQLLELQDKSPDDLESVTLISSAANHLLELINDVLEIACVEAGALALTPELVSVRNILEETLSLAQPLAAKGRVQLLELSGDVDCNVISCERRFRQIILNLLSNAVKFNSEGGTVGVSWETNEDRVRIKVADTGRGIAAEDLAKVFEPFERLDTGDMAIEGSGLGLSLSKHLIEAMGGAIGVESVFGEGTTFWVDLPLAHASHVTAARRVEAVVSSDEKSPRLRAPLTVLYIEDNIANLRLIERILALRPDVKLISAIGGQIGLDLAKRHRPDLILLDLHLPDVEGDEILRQLRADPRTEDIVIMVMSADALPDQIERLRAAGADDYLTKPIDMRRLLAVIDSTEARSITSSLN